MLLLGGPPEDAWLLRELLVDHGGFHFVLTHCEQTRHAVGHFKSGRCAVLLANLRSEKRSLRAVESLAKTCPGLPVLLLADSSDPERVARALHAGAQDHLDKRILGSQLLVRSIRNAVERCRAEHTLLHERNLLRSLIDNLPDRFYVKDREGRYLLDNIAHARFLGVRSEEEVVGKTVFDFFDPALADKMDADDRAVIRTGKPILNKEEQLLDPGGGSRWLSITKVPLRGVGGETGGTVSISRDITAQRQTREELLRANENLARALEDLRRSHAELQEAQLQLIHAEKLQSVGRLAAGIAHEVKNPLATVRMGVDFLRQHPDTPPASVLDEMAQAVDRADGVIRELLDFSSARQLQLVPTHPVQVIRKALNLVNRQLHEAKVKVSERHSKSLPEVELDPIKFEQALVNLFLNAAQAMAGGGTLCIRTRATRAARHRTAERDAGDRTGSGMHRSGSRVLIEIADTGPGIDNELAARAFDPFVTTKPTGQGTGLGLTVTRKIIELHHGTIRLSSRPPHGLLVEIALPATTGKG